MLNADVLIFQEFAMREELPSRKFPARQTESKSGLARLGGFAFAVFRIKGKGCRKFAGEKVWRNGFGNLGGD
jgi:hypothetical protein